MERENELSNKEQIGKKSGEMKSGNLEKERSNVGGEERPGQQGLGSQRNVDKEEEEE